MNIRYISIITALMATGTVLPMYRPLQNRVGRFFSSPQLTKRPFSSSFITSNLIKTPAQSLQVKIQAIKNEQNELEKKLEFLQAKMQELDEIPNPTSKLMLEKIKYSSENANVTKQGFANGLTQDFLEKKLKALNDGWTLEKQINLVQKDIKDTEAKVEKLYNENQELEKSMEKNKYKDWSLLGKYMSNEGLGKVYIQHLNMLKKELDDLFNKKYLGLD